MTLLVSLICVGNRPVTYQSLKQKPRLSASADKQARQSCGCGEHVLRCEPRPHGDETEPGVLQHDGRRSGDRL